MRSKPRDAADSSASPTTRYTQTVLLTAFDPFGGDRLNASELAARRLEGRVIAGHRVRVVILPCRFDEVAAALRLALRRTKPVLVVACGESEGRSAISIERVAINVDDARIPDNACMRPIDRAIARKGPVGYWSSLPIKAIVRALKKRKIAAEVSQTAGTFVCNHIFYQLMHFLARRPGIRGGFVHVPRTPRQASKRPGPTMPTAKTATALELVIRTALRAEKKPN